MKGIRKIVIGITTTCILAGCSNQLKVNENAPSPSSKPNLIDAELKSFSQQLIDANNRLVNARNAKIRSIEMRNHENDKLMATKFSGLDVKRDFDCRCDLLTAMQALAINLNWDMNKVLEVGRKPAQGVPVDVSINNQPLALILEQVDMQVGHFADIRIDPNFESILIEYRLLGQPRGAHNAQ